MIEPYARLAVLALLETRLVGDNLLDDLPALWAERDAIVATLPAVPPAGAQPFLLEARAAVHATQALLEASLGVTRDELATIAGGRRAATGYGAQSRTALLDIVG